ncbi:protein of unknown function [Burkholderia multivorans]
MPSSVQIVLLLDAFVQSARLSRLYTFFAEQGGVNRIMPRCRAMFASRAGRHPCRQIRITDHMGGVRNDRIVIRADCASPVPIARRAPCNDAMRVIGNARPAHLDTKHGDTGARASHARPDNKETQHEPTCPYARRPVVHRRRALFPLPVADPDPVLSRRRRRRLRYGGDRLHRAVPRA